MMEESLVKEKKKVFLVSGWTNYSPAVEKAVEKLGGLISTLGVYDPSATHMLAGKVSRSEKMLGAVASGLWVLHPSYVSASLSAGKWLDEKKYEWGNLENGFFKNSRGAEYNIAKAARKWRNLETGGSGPFTGMRVILHMPVKRKGSFSRYCFCDIFEKSTEQVKSESCLCIFPHYHSLFRLVQAGGGEVVPAKQPYSNTFESTHLFTEAIYIGEGLVDFSTLGSRGVPVMKPIYLSEFLTSDLPPTVEHFLLDKFKPYWKARVRIGGKSSVFDNDQQWAVGKKGAGKTMQVEREAVTDKTKYREELVEMLRSGKMDELDLELAVRIGGAIGEHSGSNCLLPDAESETHIVSDKEASGGGVDIEAIGFEDIGGNGMIGGAFDAEASNIEDRRVIVKVHEGAVRVEASNIEVMGAVIVNEATVVEKEMQDLPGEYACKTCTRVFSSLNWFKRHVETCRLLIQCDLCPSIIKNLKCLKRHRKNFHSKVFSCEKCDASFSTEKKVIGHYKSVHCAEKVCPMCKLKTKNVRVLRKHLKESCKGIKPGPKIVSVTPLCESDTVVEEVGEPVIDGAINDVVVSEGEAGKLAVSETKVGKRAFGEYQCRECHKSYAGKSGLRKHILTHRKFLTDNNNILPIAFIVDDSGFVTVEEGYHNVEVNNVVDI